MIPLLQTKHHRGNCWEDRP